mmetsp:Transcript_40455/g.48518  ORF Transcript_40455/g.48518 Transcript_40455/m.48518 type:complete len:81 (-) Transcript_40455:61-303(-)
MSSKELSNNYKELPFTGLKSLEEHDPILHDLIEQEKKQRMALARTNRVRKLHLPRGDGMPRIHPHQQVFRRPPERPVLRR